MELPWSESVAWRVCDTFMVRAGLSNYHPALISFRQNAIFHIPGPDISLRIYGPGENQTRATLMVISARWLKERNFPAVRLSPIEAVQPFDLLGYQTSVWQWVVADEPGQDGAFAYGRLLRRFHDLPATGAPAVPVFDQMTRILQRLDRIHAAEIISKETEAVLTGVVGRAAAMAELVGRYTARSRHTSRRRHAGKRGSKRRRNGDDRSRFGLCRSTGVGPGPHVRDLETFFPKR